MRAQFLISWKGSGTSADPYRPDLPSEVTRFIDKTSIDLSGGLPARNFFIGEVVIQETEIRRMSGDELWRETTKDEAPSEANKTDMRTSLSSKLGLDSVKLDRLGLDPVDMGLPPEERPIPATRKQIAERLAEEIRNL